MHPKSIIPIYHTTYIPSDSIALYNSLKFTYYSLSIGKINLNVLLNISVSVSKKESNVSFKMRFTQHEIEEIISEFPFLDELFLSLQTSLTWQVRYHE